MFLCNSSSQCSSDDDTVSSVSQQRASRGRRDSVVSCRVVSCKKVKKLSLCVREKELKAIMFVNVLVVSRDFVMYVVFHCHVFFG